MSRRLNTKEVYSLPQKCWNLLSAIALLLAAALAVLGISTLNFTGENRGDSLVLSSAPRHEVLGTASKGVDGWSSLRGTPLRHEELQRDSSQADQAKYKVKVGIYTTNTYDLDLSVPSFAANGYVWMRWQEPLQRYLTDNSLELDDRIILLNELLSDADPGLKAIGKAEHLADGSYYQLFTFIGRFYIDHANFRHFPFITVSLPVVIEADDVDGIFEYANLRFIPDVENSGMGLFSGIIGWLKRSWSIAEYRHTYATNFDLGGAPSAYSTLVFDIAFGTRLPDQLTFRGTLFAL